MTLSIVRRQIAWGDLDPLGIVFYPRYSEWMDGCGHLFFERIGLPLVRLAEKRGLQFGLVETRCRYRRPGRYHETVRIETTIEAVDAKTVDLGHRFFLDDEGVLMVEGKERRICLDVSDPRRLKAVNIPPDLRRILELARAVVVT
jgi:4-hydroxybenzoyl-CoA thioesterase